MGLKNTMKKRTQKHYDTLESAMADREIVKVWRQSIDEDKQEGYVVGLSKTWVLLQEIEGDAFVLGGYKAVRLDDISSLKSDGSFAGEYFQRRGLFPQAQPDLDLTDLHSLLDSVSKNYAMFMIEREKEEPDIGFVGVAEGLTKRSLWMKKFSSKAKWIDTEKFKLKDITSINFGGGYVDALIWMDTHAQEAVTKEPEATG